MAHIKVPFTPEQVEALKAWQTSKLVHPFTCDSSGCMNRGERLDDGILIPTEQGWVCPCGIFRQDWTHDFMADLRNIEELKAEYIKMGFKV